jgi:hypothetical protein
MIVEKVDFNNLKKGKKYQIKNDIITTGTFINKYFKSLMLLF